MMMYFVYLLQHLLLYLLFSINYSSTTSVSSTSHCSREISRKVHSIVDATIYSKIDDASKLPIECPLHPAHYIYSEQEKNKEKINRGEWKCSYCDKRFKSELYLDRHMDNMHKDKQSNATNMCLADLCPIFGCQSTDSSSSRSSSNSVTSLIDNVKLFNSFTANICTQKDAEKNVFKCEVILKKCFPNSEINDNGLYHQFHHNICEQISCRKGKMLGMMTDSTADSSIDLTISICQMIAVAVLLFIVFFSSKCLSLLLLIYSHTDTCTKCLHLHTTLYILQCYRLTLQYFQCYA